MTDPFVTPKELYARLQREQRQRDAAREEEERQRKATRRELLKRLAEEKRTEVPRAVRMTKEMMDAAKRAADLFTEAQPEPSEGEDPDHGF